MLRPSLALLALIGVASVSSEPADARPASIDARLEPMQLDERCFPSPRLEERRARQGAASTRAYGSGAGLGAAAPKRRSASAPPPPPAPPGARPSAPVMAEADATFGGLADDADAEESVAMVPEAEPAAATDAPVDLGGRRPIPPIRPPGPRIDWGGTIHLSNDDTMSLASAQRLLYALDRDVGFSLDQVRPHELLNYFSFETATPRGGQPFAVDASAVRADGDTLSLALAVQAANPDRPPLDLTILVDRSGSMSAEGRMAYTKRALKLASDQLRPGDRLDVVLFDDTACTPVSNWVSGRDDPAVLQSVLDRMQPRNSTDLNLGLTEAYRLATSHARLDDRQQRVMVFTDALLNTGDVDPHTVTEVGRALDQHGIRLTGVGVGREFRDDVLDRLTEKGKGAYVFLGSERVVDRLFGPSGFDALVHTVAEDVRYSLNLPDSLGMEKFYGEESSRDPEAVQPVHVHAGTSQVFLQDLAIRPGALSHGDPITLDVAWTDPANGQRRTQTFRTTVGQAEGASPHNVAKAKALMAWSDILVTHAMGGDACGAPFHAFRGQLPALQGDAEMAYVSELVGRWCDLEFPLAHWTAPARTRIQLDTDVAIGEVALSCGAATQRKALTAGETVAAFETNPGTCHVTLYGQVPMTTRVDVPATGTDLRCVVRAGRMDCR